MGHIVPFNPIFPTQGNHFSPSNEVDMKSKHIFLFLASLFLSLPYLNAQGCNEEFNAFSTMEATCFPDNTPVSFNISVQYIPQYDRLYIFNLNNNNAGLEAEIDCRSHSFTIPKTVITDGDGRSVEVTGFGVVNNDGTVEVFWTETENGIARAYSGSYTPTTVDILAPNFAGSLSVGPNPAKDFIQIISDGLPSGQSYHFQLYTMTGKLLREWELGKNATSRYSVEELPHGTYFWSVVKGDSRISSGKLILID